MMHNFSANRKKYAQISLISKEPKIHYQEHFHEGQIEKKAHRIVMLILQKHVCRDNSQGTNYLWRDYNFFLMYKAFIGKDL